MIVTLTAKQIEHFDPARAEVFMSWTRSIDHVAKARLDVVWTFAEEITERCKSCACPVLPREYSYFSRTERFTICLDCVYSVVAKDIDPPPPFMTASPEDWLERLEYLSNAAPADV